MLFGNSVTYNKCNHNIYMLFTKFDNISQNWIDMKMLFKKNICRIRRVYVVDLLKNLCRVRKVFGV